MEVIFHTNVDAKYTAWCFPKEVCCRPQVGDLVKPTNGDQILKVCAVTHCFREGNSWREAGPYLEVELTKRL
jgi:hypothetical protein